jgi:hypothetical protein
VLVPFEESYVMDGLHVVCGYAGAHGHDKAVQPHLNEIQWSETLTETGATTATAAANDDPKGKAVFVLTAGVAGWVAFGAAPDAEADPRIYLAAGETRTVFAEPGHKVAWAAEGEAAGGFPLGTPEFTIGDEETDVINVAIQLTDNAGDPIEVAAAVRAYLSDDADGSSLAATAPDGGVAIGANGVAIPLVADKAFELVSAADGTVDLDIEESGAATFYLVLIMPDGRLVVSDAITFAA